MSETQSPEAVIAESPQEAMPRERAGQHEEVLHSGSARTQSFDVVGVQISTKVSTDIENADDEDQDFWGQSGSDSPIQTVAPEGDDVGQSEYVNQAGTASIITELREQHRQRVDLHRSEKSLTLQVKARCRRLVGGDKTEAEVLYNAMMGEKGASHDLAGTAFGANLPFLQAREILETQRKATEKRLAQLGKQLPVRPWCESIKGLGIGSLAAIIGECGDLSNYSTVAKVWKRMGLAVMPDGTRQRRISGDEALEHGYSPQRRSIMWNIANSVLRSQSVRKTDPEGTLPGALRQIYDERKAFEQTKTDPKTGEPIKLGHAHNRAQRYVAKRILRDLWRAWRAA